MPRTTVKSRPKSTAISLHVGLNAVDPKHYSGWSGDLVACEFDAQGMVAIAKTRAMKSTMAHRPAGPS